MTSSSLALIVTVTACGLAACDRTPPPPPEDQPGATVTTHAANRQTVRASGSSALQPLLNTAKEELERRHPSISIEVSAGGSKKGLADVASGAVHIGNSDIFAPADLKAQLVDHKVAAVGFAAMANNGPWNARVSALTIEQLSNVFTGAVKDWKELGGSAQPIVVINRAPGSGTRTVFGNAVLGGDHFVESQTEDNSGALVAKLKQTRGAISYLALSFQDDALLTIALKTSRGIVEPTTDNIASGAYPIWSYEHMYTSGEPTGATKLLVDFVLSDEFQSKGVSRVKGFIPITRMKVSKDHD